MLSQLDSQVNGVHNALVTDTELLDKLQEMVDQSYGLSKLVSRDGHREPDVRKLIESADPVEDGIRTEPPEILRLHFDGRTGAELEMDLHYPAVMYLAAQWAQLFRDGGGANFLVVGMKTPDLGNIRVTIQREGALSPTELHYQEKLRRIAAEKRVAQLEAAMARVEILTERLIDMGNR